MRVSTQPGRPVECVNWPLRSWRRVGVGKKLSHMIASVSGIAAIESTALSPPTGAGTERVFAVARPNDGREDDLAIIAGRKKYPVCCHNLGNEVHLRSHSCEEICLLPMCSIESPWHPAKSSIPDYSPCPSLSENAI